jgi:hypothetical protein
MAPSIRTAARSAGRARFGVFAVGVLALSGWLVTTTAIWSDSVVLGVAGPGGGPLISSSFGIEQRPVGERGPQGSWIPSDHGGGISAIPFGGQTADLRQGAPVYGGVEVRSRASSLSGQLTVSPGAPSSENSLWGDLHLRLAAVPESITGTASCSASVFTTAAARTIYDGPIAASQPSEAVPIVGDAASATLLCFEVTLAQGGTAGDGRHVDATWHLNAVSD